jgi:hypothetical protein
MTNLKRLLSLAVIALAVTAAASVDAMAARTINIEPGLSISQPSQGKVSLTGAGLTVRCNLTIGGSLRSGPIAAEEGLQYGEINEVGWSACEGGELGRALFERGPWPITLRSLQELRGGTCSATLIAPRTANASNLCKALFRITGVRFLLSAFGSIVNCLYGEVNSSIEVFVELTLTREPGVYVTGLLRIREPNSIRGNTGGSCPGSGELSGTFLPASPEQFFIVE